MVSLTYNWAPIDVFYLESFSQLSSNKVESKELNENMYLVVRSLKNNNLKIVSMQGAFSQRYPIVVTN